MDSFGREAVGEVLSRWGVSFSRSPEIRRALHAETQVQLTNRVAFILALSAVALLLNVAADRHLGADVWAELVLLRVGGALAQAAAAVTIRMARRASWIRAVTLCVLGLGLACVVTAIIAMRLGDPVMLMFVLAVLGTASAMVFPWGAGPQAGLGTIAALCSLVVTDAVSPSLFVAFGAALASAVYCAWALEHERLDRKAVEMLRAGHEQTLEKIAADADVHVVLDEVLRTLSEQRPRTGWGVLLVDEGPRVLRLATQVGLPEEYARRLDGIRVDAPPVMEASIGSLAAAHGVPLLRAESIHGGDGQLYGLLVMSSLGGPRASEGDAELMRGATRLVRVAIERRRAREDLVRHLEELDLARSRAERQAEQLHEQANELVEARDQAVASMRAKSEFLANMSHEVRTPLNGVLGMAEILLDTELSQDQRHYASAVWRCGQHLLTVINDILDSSKIEAGKLVIDRIEFDLRAVIEEVTQLFAVHAQDKGVELICALAPDFAAAVLGDPARVRQVLANLISNAIKFTDHGEVAVEAEIRGEHEEEVAVRISVRDTGIGIPAERHDAIFESFTQADSSTTRKYGGTGLGLTISRKLVDLMGGRMGLDSGVGEGSVFWFDLTFPRVVAAAPQPGIVSTLAGLRVLVVDDNSTNRLIVLKSMSAWGCRTEEASGGKVALERLRAALGEDPFRLVILDMHMPGLDGEQTARRIRADPRFAGVLIVLLSSVASGHVRQPSTFDAIVPKPVRQSALLDVILGLFGVHRGGAMPRKDAGRASEPFAGVRVLVAEDNVVNRGVACEMLRAFGCTVDAVEDGRAAVEAVEQSVYDLVLLDLQMPIMDGLAATAEIRRREGSNQHTPIVALTAYAMGGDRDRCLAGGMDDYLAKPINRDALAQILGRWTTAVPAPGVAEAS